jgi:hypothetical protein
VEKKDVAFSKFIVEIRKKAKASFDLCQARYFAKGFRKSKSKILIFARLSVEK